MVPASLLSRWVSWRASTAILFVLIVWLTMVHLLRRSMLLVGALAPHIFIVAIIIFALFFIMLLFCPSVGQLRSLLLGSCVPSGGGPGSLSV